MLCLRARIAHLQNKFTFPWKNYLLTLSSRPKLRKLHSLSLLSSYSLVSSWIEGFFSMVGPLLFSLCLAVSEAVPNIIWIVADGTLCCT